ncbi:hypothetical protein COOONC_20464 [Cooperia oncophora]
MATTPLRSQTGEQVSLTRLLNAPSRRLTVLGLLSTVLPPTPTSAPSPQTFQLQPVQHVPPYLHAHPPQGNQDTVKMVGAFSTTQIPAIGISYGRRLTTPNRCAFPMVVI